VRRTLNPYPRHGNRDAYDEAGFIDLMISSVVKITKENMEEGTVGELEERRKDRLKDKLLLL
jgi:hypothetical protein